MKSFLCFYFFLIFLPLITPIYPEEITSYSQNFLQKIDPSLNSKEACVICHFLFQKLAILLDVARICPDMLDTTFVKERQRQWVPDPGFFSQWKILFEAKLHEDRRKELGLKPDGDHIYYVTAKLCNESNNTEPGSTFISESEIKKKEKNRIFTNNINEFVKRKNENTYKKNNEIIEKTEENNQKIKDKTTTNQMNSNEINQTLHSNDNEEVIINQAIQNKINKLSNEELQFMKTLGRDWEEAQTKPSNLANLNIFDMKTDINITEASKIDKNNALIDHKKIVFSDIDHKTPEVPQEWTVTHEFSNISEVLPKNISVNEKTPANYKDSYENNSIIQKVDGTEIMKASSGNNFIENKNVLDLKTSMQILEQLSNKTLTHMSSLPTPFSFSQFRFQDRKPSIFLQLPSISNINQNNINVISNTNIMTDIEVQNCSNNCPNKTAPNETQQHLTYYDVKHPTTQKLIDKNKGTVTTITDLGTVTKTIVMKPEEIDSYLDVEHGLDRQFNESDKMMHYNKDPDMETYNKPYDLATMITEAEQGDLGSSSETNGDNGTKINYKYKTSIDVNSPKQFLIKRVQTNNQEGINVNNKSYEFGKTINNYTFDNVYNDASFSNKKINREKSSKIIELNKRTNVIVNEIEEVKDININNNDGDCCSVEPCYYLTPCTISHNQQKLKKAFISNSFLQISKNSKLRNRSRFPDPQWECAEKNIKEMVDYICNEEISRSFVKYCKVLKEQINMVIESLLFHDLNDEICEKIKMCN